ncbi:hypothetical protein GCM10009609_33260 [Pseudonocardia aurantiaca]|uniref:MarR family winged helix-turn-helix transcriptional regulator n=1 Tax=Pseudonocardia aurantiaca TaxID=75290 RepID=A0ABW4FRH7_9PSEU
MPPSRGSRVDELDTALLVLRRLWQRPEVSAFLGARLDATIKLEHYRTLNAVDRSSGRISVGELAGVLKVDASTGSRLVEGMVGRGYVHRSEDACDRRRSTLDLTDLGREVLLTLKLARVAALTELTQDWRASEIADLARLLRRLDAAVRDLHGTPAPNGAGARGPRAPTRGRDEADRSTADRQPPR